MVMRNTQGEGAICGRWLRRAKWNGKYGMFRSLMRSKWVKKKSGYII